MTISTDVSKHCKLSYMEAATAAVQYERTKQFDLAARFWHQAEELALKLVNQEWAASRAGLCEKLHITPKTQP